MKNRIAVLAVVALGLLAVIAPTAACKRVLGMDCPPECVRAVVCRKGGCDGPVVQSGCCPCPAGAIDDFNCPGPRTGPTPSTSSSGR